MAKRNREKGQAVPILVIAMSLVLVGGMGLAIDAGNLYQQTQLAQVAADAAATAGISSMFQGVDVVGAPHYFSTSGTFNCTAGNDTKLPCAYARMNGFGITANDTVTVDFPTCTGSPDPCGYQDKLSANFTPNQIRVTITRNANNSIIQMLGAASTTMVRATATAAIVEVQSPTPIIITHPTYPNTLQLNGTTTLQVCGGPSRSIQVNSSNASAFDPSGGTVDLSKAGPSGNVNCTASAGADFAVFGGSYTNPGEVVLGTGRYVSRSSPIPDPFIKVVEAGWFGYTTDGNPPPRPTTDAAPPTIVPYGTGSCLNPLAIASTTDCYLFHPGLYRDSVYAWGLKPHHYGSGSTTYALFEPGLYYVEHTPQGPNVAGADFTQTTGGNNVDYGGLPLNNSVMCTTCPTDTYTGHGMLIYDTGPQGSTLGNNPSGGFNVGTQANVVFTGPTKTMVNAKGDTVPAPPYYNIVFWEDRTANAHAGTDKHVMGTGMGCFTLNEASLYMTNTREKMLADPTHYQAVNYAGTPCSGTQNRGNIIVGTLNILGNSTITMNLVPAGFVYLDQIALVAGGPHP
jgi:putative Flp pilus-assembly TadE/G-like protein